MMIEQKDFEEGKLNSLNLSWSGGMLLLLLPSSYYYCSLIRRISSGLLLKSWR